MPHEVRHQCSRSPHWLCPHPLRARENRALTYGNKIGHTPGAHPVYNGWAASMDFGPNDWGYLRVECIGGYDSW